MPATRDRLEVPKKYAFVSSELSDLFAERGRKYHNPDKLRYRGEPKTLGFKPSTVYKAQGQLRRLNTKVDLPQQLETPEEQATERVSFREELAHILDRISELETKAGSADEWEKKYHDLERRLDDKAEAMGRKVQDWQERFVAEQKARNRAEALAAQHSAEVARLEGANQELQQKLDSLPEHLAQEVWKLVQPLNAELEELRPLKIWAGHSCTLSDNPTPDQLRE